MEGDDEADIFAVGGMSIVRVSLPKISRSRLVGAGNAIGDRLGGVTWLAEAAAAAAAAAAVTAAVTGPRADGCSITDWC